MTPQEIRQVRLTLGLSHTQMSLALGVNRRTISRWESGQRVPGKPTQKLIQSLLKERESYD